MTTKEKKTMMHSELADTIRQGIEATFYVSTTADGLKIEELKELCRRFDYQEGETSDTLDKLFRGNEIEKYIRDPIIRLSKSYPFFSTAFLRFDPDPRNLGLFDLILQEITDAVRKQGERKLRMNSAYLAQKLAAQSKATENEVRIAIRQLERYRFFVILDGYIQEPKPEFCTPETVENMSSGRATRKNRKRFDLICNIVEEILSRRTDGRPVSTDVFIAFEEQLPGLGVPQFLPWWRSTLAELRSLDERLHCSSVIIKAASLCEAALTFVAVWEKTNGLFVAKELGDEPEKWKLRQLIISACKGQEPLLHQKLRERLLELVEMRKIVHPGSFLNLSGLTKKIPEMASEQATASTETLKLLLRTIIERISVNRANRAVGSIEMLAPEASKIRSEVF